MSGTEYQIGIVAVYFIYGLAFFSMGLAMALEAGRSPLLAEARILRPLAVFGILHGIHEWLEIFLLETLWLGLPYPPLLLWMRIGLLVFSFVSLVAYGVQVLKPPQRLAALDAAVGLILIIGYTGVVFLSCPYSQSDPFHFTQHADVLARYFLAVPGAILAALALHRQAQTRTSEYRKKLAGSLNWAAFGFLVYGLTQLFVSKLDIFPARFLNGHLFLELFGLPVQALRAVLALVIMINLNRATHFVERERQLQLLTAQTERMNALKRVQDEMENREKMRQELLRHIVTVQEEERTKIARELHDETAQTLTAFSLNLASIETLLPENSPGIALVKRLRSLAKKMSQGLYRMVHDLRPAQLDDLGLIPAIQYLIDEGQAHTGLKVDLSTEGSRQRMDPLVETVLFRVTQEALTNVSRHAQVDQASIHLRFSEDRVKLTIQDRGMGFDVDDEGNQGKGLGLVGMRERTESLGGTLQIKSNPGSGTIIEATIPCNRKYNPIQTEEEDSEI